MIRRVIRRRIVQLMAWGLRRGIPMAQLRAAVDQSFAHQSSQWRDDLLLDALARNRERLMRKINA